MEFYQFKQNFHKNKKLYTGIAIGAISAGFVFFTYVMMRERYATLTDSVDGRELINAPVTMRSFSFLSKPTNTAVVTIHKNHRGHPGFPVKNMETGAEFATQGDAANAFGITARSLSQHLNGKRDHAEGLHFERIMPWAERL